MADDKLFGGIYAGKCALVTGHTGFKGSWLSLWLCQLGARVVGFSLPPETDPNHIELVRPAMESILGDVRDRSALEEVMSRRRPEVVFHLAAQPLVRRSYREPLETLSTNVLGTAQVLQACRDAKVVRAIVCVTSDKVYEVVEPPISYRETDRLGGRDPYSCSKGCAELVAACYRQSYFPVEGYGTQHHTLLASARAGNVIGGGDWAEDRLIPDAVKAAACGEPVVVRNPRSVRPWQHVLEPLAGYLLLGQKLLQSSTRHADAWNFGPADAAEVAVEAVIRRAGAAWPAIRAATADASGPHETRVLRVDSSKARQALDWQPVWDWEEAVDRTARWYAAYYRTGAVSSRDDLAAYIAQARRGGFVWTQE
jgi:CDP-glucose 4,6-dehydratase